MNNLICVVGAGYWGKNHIRTLLELECLGGIVEPNEVTRKELNRIYPEIECFDSVEKALKKNNIKGFTVATPAYTHFEIASKIIKKQKHVLVEKPLCLNIEDAKNLLLLANQNNVNLFVGHVLLFHPAIQKIKDIILSGEIGKLQYIYSNRLNLGQVRNEENAFWSLAPHDISIFQYLTNDFPENINAHGSSFLQKDIHDSTITYLKYPNGVEGHIFVSWLHPFKEHRLVVIGSEAMIVFEDSAKDKPLTIYSKKFDIKLNALEKIDGPIKLVKYENKMPLTEELRYFSKKMSDKKADLINGKHALEVIEILTLASKQLEKS